MDHHELNRTDCFLCRPRSRLLAHVGTIGYTMAGLGPLTHGYAITSVIEHVERLKSLDKSALQEYARYAENIQSVLARRFGNCVLTEHGNMAVCHVNSQGHTHCFHPHFLMFPAVSDPTDKFRAFFKSDGAEFKSLYEALEYGTSAEHYILVSPAPSRYIIFVPNDGLPRQIARGLVAEHMDVEHLADWRAAPDFRWSLESVDI